MKYVLNRNFKALNPFEIELPDFVILTGINGVGKTQILQALTQERSAILTENNKELNRIKIFDSTNLVPNHNHQLTVNSNNNSNSFHHTGRKFDPHYKLYEEMFNCQTNNLPIISESDYLNPIQPEGLQNEMNYRYKITPQKSIYASTKKIFDLHQDSIKLDYEIFAKKIELAVDPFTNELFHQNFTNTFYSYHSLIHKNQYNEFKNRYKKQNVTYLSDIEFKKLNGIEPWILINTFLSEANLDFEFQQPEEFDLDQTTYDVNFVKKSTGNKILINDLSSGEKVLISLFFAIYNKNTTNYLPEIILLDETDASLHPSMSKEYLSILKNIFVKELKIKVIITTHSPSTIALADEEDIYVVEKMPMPIRKCDKDEALSVLTTGVPSLSINHMNRKQVFVESVNDVEFYDEIYKKLKTRLVAEISLNFISSGDSRSDTNGDPIANCAQVKKITHIMRDSGNKSCFGIIDWDLHNHSEDNGVFINAIDTFYSIENCLLNPLAIGIILIHETDKDIEELGMKISNINRNNENELQKISDWVIEKIQSQFNKDKNSLITTKLVNGLHISIPEWYCYHQGHQLEEKILKVFPKLNAIKAKSEKKLKLAIISKVFGEFPELIPSCFIEIFSKIQKS